MKVVVRRLGILFAAAIITLIILGTIIASINPSLETPTATPSIKKIPTATWSETGYAAAQGEYFELQTKSGFVFWGFKHKGKKIICGVIREENGTQEREGLFID